MPLKPSPPRTLGATAVHGVATLMIASLLAKLAGIATIYVTGKVLTKSDFAIYAIAIAWGEIFGYLQNGGLHRFLVQRERAFDHHYAPIFGMSLAINLLWFAILIVAAPYIASAYKAPEVSTLIILFGLSLPLGTMSIMLRTNLLVNLRFGDLSVLDVYAALLRNGGVIVLALMGFGPMSFVLPVIAVAAFESLYLCRTREKSWRPAIPRRRLLAVVFKPMMWIALSMVAATLIINGDYLVIGFMESKETLGIYFFGFQLTVAILTLFTHSLRAVFISSFVTIGNDRPRQERAFQRSLELSALLLFFMLFGVATVAEPLISWIWAGKWDAAILIVQITAVASLARVVSPVSRSLLEARGEWRTVACLAWVEGLGLVGSAAFGAVIGGLVEICIAVGAYMMIVGVIYIAIVLRHTELPPMVVVKSVLWPYALACGALATAWAVGAAFGPFPHPALDAFVKGTAYTASFTLLIYVFSRPLLFAAIDVVRKRYAR